MKRNFKVAILIKFTVGDIPRSEVSSVDANFSEGEVTLTEIGESAIEKLKDEVANRPVPQSVDRDSFKFSILAITDMDLIVKSKEE